MKSGQVQNYIMETFKDTGLSPEIMKAITEMGFEAPTPIQAKTIPAILENKNDLIALAQTGTGKTAAFGLPILEQIDISNKNVQSLLLCPTRELCLQISKDLNNFAKYQKGLKVLAVYGGTSIVPQMKDLRSGSHVVVGTPGRTLDLIKRKALRVDNIQWLVLDEADEMLQMGFKDELDAILEGTPENKQTLLFSATMPDGVRKISKNYMTNPDELSVGKKNQGADKVNHVNYMVKAADKYKALKRLADIHPEIYGIVFCRTRRETKEVADKLIQDGYNADALHGDLSQSQRDFVMERFRSNALQILVATDVAARGLDVNELTHVINYNLPDDPEVYVHRSGRTGRAGRSGTSIAIIHSRETRRLRDIERILNKKFEYQKVPSGKEICGKRLINLMDKVENVVIDEKQVGSFLPEIIEKLEHLDRDELIKRFVSVEFNRFLEYYKNAGDLNVSAGSERGSDRGSERRAKGRDSREGRDSRPAREGRDSRPAREGRDSRPSREGRESNSQFSRFYINVGSKQNIAAAHLIGMINDFTNKRDMEIGKIDILRKFSFFEVEKQNEKLVLDAFEGKERDGIDLNLQLSTPTPDTRSDSQKRKPSGNYKRESKSGDRKSYKKRSSDNRGSRR